jgi:transketolase N-terminal domain/subunit
MAAASATTAAGHLHAALGRRDIFLVEYVERRQADVGDFFHAERQLMVKSKGRRRRHIRRRNGSC